MRKEDANKAPTEVGRNRTGIATSPKQADELIQDLEAATPQTSFDVTPIENVRSSQSSGAEPVGSSPPPVSLKGAAKTILKAVKGEKPTVFLDQLGERLAFERQGVRLYEALISKLNAASVQHLGPTRGELERIRDQELEHFALLEDAFERLGGDPTAMTPSADIMSVATSGVLAVVSDTRTTLTEALKAVLIAELTDVEGWSLLRDLAAKFGEDELATEFQRAEREEEQHLILVRGWLAHAVEGQAGVDGEPASEPRTTPPLP